MSPWPFVVTTSATVHGVVFLLGTADPVEAVYIDGRSVVPIASVALPSEISDLPEEFAGRALSLAVPLPDWVRVGSHRLRVVQGGETAQRRFVVRNANVQIPEIDAGCLRSPHTGHVAVMVSASIELYDSQPNVTARAATVAVVIQDGEGLRIVPASGAPGMPEYSRSITHLGERTVIQRVYEDGTLGQRWLFADPVRHCNVDAVALPGGPGIPLWLDASSAEPATPPVP